MCQSTFDTFYQKVSILYHEKNIPRIVLKHAMLKQFGKFWKKEFIVVDGKLKRSINWNEEIQQKLNELDMKPVQTIFSSIKKQLRKTVDKGPYAGCSF